MLGHHKLLVRARFIAAVMVAMGAWSSAARASSPSPRALALSLQRNPVQSIDVPPSSFTALSRPQIESLRTEIAAVDPGRFWIMVLSPRSGSALSEIAHLVYGDLPAGTLIGVAEDSRDASTTNWWVTATWETGGAAEGQLNDAIQGFHRGQGSFFDDLRMAIRRLARADARAGHPSLASAGGPQSSSGGSQAPAGTTQSSAAGPGGSAASSQGSQRSSVPPSSAARRGHHSGSSFPVALLVAGVMLALLVVLIGTRYARGALRISHRRHEESADAHKQAQADFIKLGEQITALDIDSSLAHASAAGKDEYGHAVGCYAEAERRLKHADDDYQFQKAVNAIKAGLRHVHAADQLFNPTRDPNEEVDQLSKLAALHKSGALTDAEFAEQKAKLIG